MNRVLRPATPEAMKLLTEGSAAMSRIECAGMRVDVGYLRQAIKDTEKLIAGLQAELHSFKEWKAWTRKYGNRIRIGSSEQLADVIFGEMGHKRNPLLVDPHTGQHDNRASAFEHLTPRVPFLKLFFRVRRLQKAVSTNLYGLLRETVNGFVHPFFNLTIPESYRGSCSDPNMQNSPVRDKEVSEIVRRAIVPRPGCVLIETDYGQQEVRVAQCYTHDPVLGAYIKGAGDMHRDMAKRVYLLSDEEMGPHEGKGSPGKAPRYASKNMMVFPQFYGSVYVQCAPNLWDAISRLEMKTATGMDLYTHLKRKGIKGLGACDYEKEPVEGTFEYVVAQAEKFMWEETFTVYKQWKQDWWNAYLRRGGVNTLTGFRMEGVFKRNQILCDPIQGSAFHCLLYGLIQALGEIEKRKMDSLIVNQIHDSALGDVPEREVDEYCAMMKECVLDRVLAHWDWITVPLAVEFEICRENWAGKVPFQPV